MKHFYLFKALPLLTFLCWSFSVKAQLYCPTNINLESGNLSNWNFYIGNNSGSSGLPSVSSVSSARANRHVLTSGSATDYYGGFPIVDPNGGNYSLKLGNDLTGAQIDQARYTLTVPANLNNYSLIYRYAVVFEDPAHTTADQPYFRVRVYNATTGAVINCASFTYFAQGNIPGFITSPSSAQHTNGTTVYYKPWSTASINLSGQAGNTLIVEFTTADCALGAHMGYGYVDISCGLFAITSTSCTSTTPLSAPPGFQYYKWYNSNYSTLIDSGQSINVPTPSGPTQYHVVLTPFPGYGCMDTLTTQISAAYLHANAGKDTMLCKSPGVVLTPTVSGTRPPYTYSWAPASGLSCTNCMNPTASPSVNTSYVLTVTDSIGCSRKDTILVKAPLTLSTATTPSPCFGMPGGSATAAAGNGAAPYAYIWNTSPAQSSATATALPAGTYSVTATDANGCTASGQALITSAPQLIAGISHTDSVSCFGGSDGKAAASATGGTAPYSYSWSTTPAQAGANASGLRAGAALLTVTDSKGCTDTATAVISQPLPMTMGITLTPVICRGGSTGTATINAGGGFPPYTYAVNAGAFGASQTLSGLNAGSHVLHVKDARGCTTDSTVLIGEPAPITIAYTASLPSCYGSADGAISLSGSGGLAPYQYAIGAGAFGSNGQFSGLAAGAFTMHIRDANGCLADSTVSLSQPGPVHASLSITHVSCNGGNAGGISLSGSGGTPGYTYALGTGAYTGNSSFTGLAAGTYIVHIRDAHGCTKDTGGTIIESSAISLAFTATEPLCHGAASGRLQITGSGGTAPYQFALNTGAFGTSGSFTGLAAGTYTLRIKDANNCIRDSIVSLGQPSALILTSSWSDVRCNGGNDGSAIISASGGTAPYTYAAGTGSFGTAHTFPGLSAGNHILHVKDAHGCTTDSSILITEPTAITIAHSTTPPLCYGGTNGAINLAAAGGTRPYLYAIGTGSFSSNAGFSGLSAGAFQMHVRDANGCTADSLVSLAQPLPLNASLAITHVDCHGASSGTISVTGTGGTPGFTYALGSAAFGSNANFTGLAAGAHIIHIRDANGCTKDSLAAITEPAALAINYSAAQPLCFGASNGQLQISGSGGTAPYLYALNTGAFGASGAFTGLQAGTYTLRIRDTRGCRKDSIITINQPAALSLSASRSDVRCHGGSDGSATLTVSGGTAPYTYAWTGTSQTGATATGFSAGTYTATVTDARGCTGSASVTIAQPAALAASLSSVAPVCHNTATGSATVSATGGTVPYTYSWNTTPARTTATAGGLPSGAYTVTITDGHGCTLSANTSIAQTNPVTVSFTPTPVSCFGGKDGSATATASGSTSPYTYSWNTNPAQTGAAAASLPAGTYTVTATSAAGCTGTGQITITEPPALAATATSTGTCPGTSAGSITAAVNGGTVPYYYQWVSRTNTGPLLTNLNAGTYTLIVTDSKGCKDTASATVALNPNPEISAGADQEICRGSDAKLQASGALQYIWTPSATLSCAACSSPIASPAVNTVYTVIGTDEYGCSNTDTVQIKVVQRAPVSIGEKLTICEGDSARLSVQGGTEAYWLTHDWLQDPQSTSPVVKPSRTTVYRVAVTENRCFKDTLEQEVEVLPTPAVDLGPDLEAVIGATVRLRADVTNASKITWSPAEGLSCATCFMPEFTVKGKATFIATVENFLGCSATDTVRIRDVCDANYFYFANVFTPNGDGQNDRFYPQSIGISQISRFMIYDRWGEIVFSASNIYTNDPAAGWDGTFRNQSLKPDVFVYVMDAVCESGKKVVMRGDISLIR